MKKNIASVICIFLLANVFAQVSFVPSFDIFSLTQPKTSVPYFDTHLDAKCMFTLQAFPQAYLDASITANLANPADFFHLDKTKRKPIESFYLSAALTFPRIKNKNVYLALFYGQYDYLNSDKILRETAKVKMESPAFQRDFPTSSLRPDLPINGLGTALYGCLDYLPVYFAGYAYWNGEYTKDKFEVSTDFRVGHSFYAGAVNAFVGAKFSQDIKKTELRAGISGVFQSDDAYEFYYDAGFDKLTFPIKEFYKRLYVLFEPRGTFDKFSFGVPFFMAPVSSLPKYMNESGYQDKTFLGMGLKLAGGNLEKYNFEVGASLCAAVNPVDMGQLSMFTFSVSPFVTFAFSRYALDLRVNIHPFAYADISKAVNVSIQLKAVK